MKKYLLQVYFPPPFTPLPLVTDLTTTTNNSNYTSDDTTQKVTNSRKASSDPYYYNLQSLIREARKQKPRTDPNYIESKYLNDLIQYSKRNWPGNYQLQYSFLLTELSYHKDTKHKSWYVYYDPPRGMTAQEYNAIKKRLTKPRLAIGRNSVSKSIIRSLPTSIMLFLYGGAISALRKAKAIIVDINPHARYIVAKLPISAGTTVVNIHGEDFF